MVTFLRETLSMVANAFFFFQKVAKSTIVAVPKRISEGESNKYVPEDRLSKWFWRSIHQDLDAVQLNFWWLWWPQATWLLDSRRRWPMALCPSLALPRSLWLNFDLETVSILFYGFAQCFFLFSSHMSPLCRYSLEPVHHQQLVVISLQKCNVGWWGQLMLEAATLTKRGIYPSHGSTYKWLPKPVASQTHTCVCVCVWYFTSWLTSKLN